MRLLRLPQEVRASVASGALSMGHARALLGIADEQALMALARDVLARGLSVRETEALIRKAQSPKPAAPEPQKDVHTRAAEEKLRLALGTRVEIARGPKGGGRIEIAFTNEDELNRLYDVLTAADAAADCRLPTVDRRLKGNADWRLAICIVGLSSGLSDCRLDCLIVDWIV